MEQFIFECIGYLIIGFIVGYTFMSLLIWIFRKLRH